MLCNVLCERDQGPWLSKNIYLRMLRNDSDTRQHGTRAGMREKELFRYDVLCLSKVGMCSR